MKTPDTAIRGALAAALLLAGSSCLPGGMPDGEEDLPGEAVRIPMRDGVELHGRMLRPRDGGPFPTLVFRTPYGAYATAREAAFPSRAADAGYLVFVVDVRGRYGSAGEFEAYRHEKEDGFDTIEWVAAHPLSDGRVGSWGGSYPGFVQWLAMSEAPPSLVAAAPAMTPVGSHHFVYYGGAFALTWYEWFATLILPDLRRRAGDHSGPWTVDSSVVEWARARDSVGVYRARPLDSPDLLRRHAPYFYDWLANPDSSAYWDFAQIQDDFSAITAPALIVDGWYDNAYGLEGATRGFNGLRDRGGSAEAREHTRLVIGPWGHQAVEPDTREIGELDFGRRAGMELGGLQLRWFDRRLRGIRNGIDDEPPVRLFVMGENRWRAFDSWPPRQAREVRWHLAASEPANGRGGGGRLLRSRGEALADGRSGDDYRYDPADPVWNPHFDRSAGPHEQTWVESRRDVLVYTSEPLAEDLVIAGEVAVDLQLSSDRPDTDFAFMLTDVHPDGSSYNLAGPEAGFLRMRYREGFDRQLFMEEGEVYRVRIGGLYTANRFRAGHRVRLQITSSRAPELDPNPNTAGPVAEEADPVPAHNRIWHDADRLSGLVLPVLEGG